MFDALLLPGLGAWEATPSQLLRVAAMTEPQTMREVLVRLIDANAGLILNGVEEAWDAMNSIEREYPGVIAVLRHAEEQGFPIHVATRSTCAEHIEEGDDKAESWALQPSLVLDVERLARALVTGTDETGLDPLLEPEQARHYAESIAAEYARLGDPTDG
jgi:hypothetical protein